MEDSEPPLAAIESFSETWLLNSISFNNNNTTADDDALVIDEEAFKFDIPSPRHQYCYSPSYSYNYNLVHADDLFFNGRLKPNKYYHYNVSPPTPLLKTNNSSSSSSYTMRINNNNNNGSTTSASVVKSNCRQFLEKLQKSSGNILRRCLRFLVIGGPLMMGRRVVAAGTRKRSRVGDITRNNSFCSINNSVQGKPHHHHHHHHHHQAAAYARVDYYNRSNNDNTDESPIYDAVLHCKRSIG